MMEKSKIFTRLKEILNTGLSPQDLIVIILLGGFCFLIQATISPNQNLLMAYSLYFLTASFFLMFVRWKERNK